MRNEKDVAVATAIFKSIQDEFPHLTMRLDTDFANFDVELDIPAQDGLTIPVNLNLQADELHMEPSNIIIEYGKENG